VTVVDVKLFYACPVVTSLVLPCSIGYIAVTSNYGLSFVVGIEVRGLVVMSCYGLSLGVGLEGCGLMVTSNYGLSATSLLLYPLWSVLDPCGLEVSGLVVMVCVLVMSCKMVSLTLLWTWCLTVC